jgi:hypothetical protein
MDPLSANMFVGLGRNGTLTRIIALEVPKEIRRCGRDAITGHRRTATREIRIRQREGDRKRWRTLKPGARRLGQTSVGNLGHGRLNKNM